MVENFAKDLFESKKIVSEDEFVSVEELLRKTDGPIVDDVFGNKKNDSGKEKNFDETNSVEEDQEPIDVEEDQEPIDVEEVSRNQEEIIDVLDSSSDEEEGKRPKKKKTEVERLAIENKEFQEPLKDRRSRRSGNNCYQFCNSHWMASMVGEGPMCNMVEVIGGQLLDITDK